MGIEDLGLGRQDRGELLPVFVDQRLSPGERLVHFRQSTYWIESR